MRFLPFVFLVAFLLITSAAQARPPTQKGDGYSMRFYGNSSGDIDRVKLPLDNPSRPIDVTAQFTLEWWMKAERADNPIAECRQGRDNWALGHVLIDRDIYNDSDFGDYGVAIGDGRIMFGISSGLEGDGFCGSSDVTDGRWHHIAITRPDTGRIQLWVDGQLDGQMQGPQGNISYRDNRPTQAQNDPFLVIGAEKHGLNNQSFSYSGLIDEVRISAIVRYDKSFIPPTEPFQDDPRTMGLYHFDEGTGEIVRDSASVFGGPTNGRVHYGGSPAGPEWSRDNPFSNQGGGTPTPIPTPSVTPNSNATVTPTATATATTTTGEGHMLYLPLVRRR
jgi:hypothetical protein